MSANKNHDIKKVGKINVKNYPYDKKSRYGAAIVIMKKEDSQ